MTPNTRARFDLALEGARRAAYPPGEYVGQESFMRATEIRDLAAAAGIDARTSVLDLCCGVAGPGRLLRRELGCDYLGVDASADAVEVARGRARDHGCRFAVAEVPPVPEGPFDVVLLLETLLAFPEKQPLLDGIARAVRPGGRFACTVEVGAALDHQERERMPRSDTVWPVPLPDLLAVLSQAGLRVSSAVDVTTRHHGVAVALAASFEADRHDLGRRLGRAAVAELLAAHRLWSEWLGTGRVRKVALVATKELPGEPGGSPLRSSR